MTKFWILEQKGVEMGTWQGETEEDAFRTLAESLGEEYREMEAEEITETEYREIDRLIEEKGMGQREALDELRKENLDGK